MTQAISTLVARHDADPPAVGVPGRAPLSYGALRKLGDDTRAALHGFGIGRGDRVAIVLPNGPDMATAFITIAQTAGTAPLNPAYRQDEYEVYLQDLRAKALVVPDDDDGPTLPPRSRAAAAPPRR
jgi:acyl-CoA synthetase (AMP-forming)/AMP-acid ligase II